VYLVNYIMWLFRCKRYVDGLLFRDVVAVKEIMISPLDKLVCVSRLCYLGDLIGGAGGGANKKQEYAYFSAVV